MVPSGQSILAQGYPVDVAKPPHSFFTYSSVKAALTLTSVNVDTPLLSAWSHSADLVLVVSYVLDIPMQNPLI